MNAYSALSVLLVIFSSVAAADCRIKNDTKYNFSVTNGNTSNISFGANNSVSFRPGSLSGTSKEGKSFSGACSGSEYLAVKEENGALVVKKN